MLRFHTLYSPEPVAVPTFQKGEKVFLANGSYRGTVGTFLNFRDDDPKWADILEQNSQVRSHPVEWLQHSSRDCRAIMLHAILVDGLIERVEGSPVFADSEVRERRKAGHVSEYLFGARSEQEFEKKRNEKQSA